MAARRKKAKARVYTIKLGLLLGIVVLLGLGKTMLQTTYSLGEKEEKRESIGEQEEREEEQQESKQAMKSNAINAKLITLVNKDHPVPSDYNIALRELNNGRNSVAEVMYEDLKSMLHDASKEGHSYWIASGYRSKEYQQQLIDNNVASRMSQGMEYEEAYEDVIKLTMPAGYSEHQLGLAVDLLASSNNKMELEQEDTRENEWLRMNCYRYGFVLRYPKDKEAITHINYEPWHFRYVGKEVATYIWEHDLTLEEFLE